MERLNAVVQIVATVGVVVGLILVAVELRQNTETTRAQTRAEISQAIVGLIEREADPRVLEARLKQERGDELLPEERLLLSNLANATFRVWENSYYQYTKQLFDDAEFAADLQVWGELMREPIEAALWAETRHTYSPGMRRVIDSIVAAQAP